MVWGSGPNGADPLIVAYVIAPQITAAQASPMASQRRTSGRCNHDTKRWRNALPAERGSALAAASVRISASSAIAPAACPTADQAQLSASPPCGP